jgi:hypothetical protein
VRKVTAGDTMQKLASPAGSCGVRKRSDPAIETQPQAQKWLALPSTAAADEGGFEIDVGRGVWPAVSSLDGIRARPIADAVRMKHKAHEAHFSNVNGGL